MKISVIIPAYNEAEVLGPTLAALSEQDYNDYEIIVVNNASTDATHDVASSFAKITVVDEPRKGLLYARECGRKAATGDIIANTDADCLPGKDWLRNAVAHFDSPEVAVVSGPVDYHDADPIFRSVSGLIQKTFYSPVNAILQRTNRGALMLGGNNFIRADVLKNIGGYDTSILFYGEDTDTVKKAAKYGKVLFKNDIMIKTSARRFKNQGALKTFYYYLANFFWMTFRGKPFMNDSI